MLFIIVFLYGFSLLQCSNGAVIWGLMYNVCMCSVNFAHYSGWKYLLSIFHHCQFDETILYQMTFMMCTLSTLAILCYLHFTSYYIYKLTIPFIIMCVVLSSLFRYSFTPHEVRWTIHIFLYHGTLEVQKKLGVWLRSSHAPVHLVQRATFIITKTVLLMVNFFSVLCSWSPTSLNFVLKVNVCTVPNQPMFYIIFIVIKII